MPNSIPLIPVRDLPYFTGELAGSDTIVAVLGNSTTVRIPVSAIADGFIKSTGNAPSTPVASGESGQIAWDGAGVYTYAEGVWGKSPRVQVNWDDYTSTSRFLRVDGVQDLSDAEAEAGRSNLGVFPATTDQAGLVRLTDDIGQDDTAVPTAIAVRMALDSVKAVNSGTDLSNYRGQVSITSSQGTELFVYDPVLNSIRIGMGVGTILLNGKTVKDSILAETPAVVDSRVQATVPGMISATVPGMVDSRIQATVPQLVASETPGIVNDLVPGIIDTTVPAMLAAQVPAIADERITALVPAIIDSSVPGMIDNRITATLPGKLAEQVPPIADARIQALTPAIVEEQVSALVPSILETQVPPIATSQIEQLAPGIADTRIRTLAPGIAEEKVNSLAPAIADTRIQDTVPGMIDTAIAGQVPALVTSGINSQVPAIVSSAINSQVPAIVSSSISSQVPDLVTAGIDEQVPLIVESEINSRVPSIVADELATQVPTLVYEELEAQVPTVVNRTVAEQVPGMVTDGINSQVPALVTAGIDSQVPGIVDSKIEQSFEPELMKYMPTGAVDTMVLQTPTGDDNANGPFAELDAMWVPAAIVTKIEVKMRTGGDALPSVWLGIWERNEADTEWEKRGVSIVSVAQNIGGTSTWEFADMELHGRRIRLQAMTEADGTLTDTGSIWGVRSSPVATGDTSLFGTLHRVIECWITYGQRGLDVASGTALRVHELDPVAHLSSSEHTALTGLINTPVWAVQDILPIWDNTSSYESAIFPNVTQDRKMAFGNSSAGFMTLFQASHASYIRAINGQLNLESKWNANFRSPSGEVHIEAGTIGHLVGGNKQYVTAPEFVGRITSDDDKWIWYKNGDQYVQVVQRAAAGETGATTLYPLRVADYNAHLDDAAVHLTAEERIQLSAMMASALALDNGETWYNNAAAEVELEEGATWESILDGLAEAAGDRAWQVRLVLVNPSVTQISIAEASSPIYAGAVTIQAGARALATAATVAGKVYVTTAVYNG